MIHIAADTIIAAKHARIGAPAALAGATFALPGTVAPEAADADLAARQTDAATGTDVPAPDAAALPVGLPTPPLAPLIELPAQSASATPEVRQAIAGRPPGAGADRASLPTPLPGPPASDPTGAAPAPLHFAVSASLAATIGDLQKAGSPLMPPPAAAPARPEPTPMPAHWQVAPNVALSPAVIAAAAASPAGIPLPAAVLPVRGFDRRPEQTLAPGAGDAAQLLAPATFAPIAEPPALDLGREGWPADMMAHIEQLRDAADAADTRIRLAPDMLGSVDIDVRRDGDTLQVRFSAEQAHTRALLQDAQPRLAEAAEARGLKLGGSSVDAGPQGQHRQPAAQPAVALRRTTPAAVADGQEPADDARIA